MRTPDHPGPQSDPLSPGERVDSQVTGHHRDIQVVPALCLYIHVASKDLRDKIREGERGEDDLMGVRAKSMENTLGQAILTAVTHVVSGSSNYPDMDLHGRSETVEWS